MRESAHILSAYEKISLREICYQIMRYGDRGVHSVRFFHTMHYDNTVFNSIGNRMRGSARSHHDSQVFDLLRRQLRQPQTQHCACREIHRRNGYTPRRRVFLQPDSRRAYQRTRVQIGVHHKRRNVCRRNGRRSVSGVEYTLQLRPSCRYDDNMRASALSPRIVRRAIV